jgi:hypothetical protein
MHEAQLPDGSWHTVVRIDCAHQEVHIHTFFGEESRTVIRPIYSQADVIETMQDSYNRIFENWEENERQWRDGRTHD